MAITRAQQVRQMLEDGGMLVSPSKDGKRPGYRRSNYDTSGGGTRSSTKAPGSAGPMGGGSPKSDREASENRVAAATDTKAMQKAYGIKSQGLTPSQKQARERGAAQRAATQQSIKDQGGGGGLGNFFDTLKKFGLPTQRLLYNAFPNNPNTELAFLSGLTQEQVDALDNKELSDLYSAIQDADFAGDLSFEDALGDKYGKLSYDGFRALSQRGIDTNFQDPQGKFGNMDFAEYAARIKGKPGLLFSGNVGNIQTIKNADGTYSFVERPDDRGSSQETDPCKGPNPPAYCFIGEKADETVKAQRNLGGLAPRITGSIYDFTGMADGGRIGAAEGGIMDLETAREAMFLGGIVKGLKKITKKATRAVKKVAKSPIGKAALLGLGAYYMPGFGIKATGGFSNFTQPGGFLSKILTKGGDKALSLDNLSGLKISGLLTAAPFLFGKTEEEDDPDPNRGPKLTMEELLAIRGAPFNTLASRFTGSTFAAEGGRMGYQEGSKEPVAKKVMPLLDMGGKEMDLRDNGGFVPIGRMEKADDVPARLSKNEFVFTAEAVRNAGDGDVDKGSEVMYNMMKNLEDGGNVSEESQGLEGARDMFQTAQRLQEII